MVYPFGGLRLSLFLPLLLLCTDTGTSASESFHLSTVCPPFYPGFVFPSFLIYCSLYLSLYVCTTSEQANGAVGVIMARHLLCLVCRSMHRPISWMTNERWGKRGRGVCIQKSAHISPLADYSFLSAMRTRIRIWLAAGKNH